MNKKSNNWKNSLIGGLAAIISLSNVNCCNTQNMTKGYDNHTRYVTDESIEEIVNNVYKINVDTVYLTDKGEIGNRNGFGSTFPILGKEGELYFATCYHVLDTPDSMPSPFTHDVGKKVKEEYSLTINGTKTPLLLAKYDKDKDVALLMTLEEFSIKCPTIANEQLMVGDAVYTLGFTNFENGKMLNSGNINHVLKHEFIMTSALNPGNSGGPVYVCKNGELQVAGMNRYIVQGMNDVYGAIKIDEVKKLL